MRIETIALHPLIRMGLGHRLGQKLISHSAGDVSPDARVAHNVLLRGGENISIGEGTIVDFSCELHAWGRIRIGRSVIISPQCVILTGAHELRSTGR